MEKLTINPVQIEKLTFSQMADKFREFNDKYHCEQFDSKHYLIGVIVYRADNWTKEYSLESRSYAVHSGNKLFIAGMGGNSVYGSSLDGTDKMVRLDWQGWKIDYCYIKKEVHLK